MLGGNYNKKIWVSSDILQNDRLEILKVTSAFKEMHLFVRNFQITNNTKAIKMNKNKFY